MQTVAQSCRGVQLKFHSSQGEDARGTHLSPLAGLEAAVRVDPEQLAVAAQQVHIQEGLDLALNELHAARATAP